MTEINLLKYTDFTDADYTRFREEVAEEKRERIDRYRFAADYKRSLLGDAMARKMIQNVTGIAGGDLDIRTDANGKPYVNNADHIHFNLSHSGEYVACILSDRPCGIDVELMKEGNSKIARRFFPESEYRYILDGAEEMRKERFYEIWTAREAYSKLEGVGIVAGFDSFEIVKRRGEYAVMVDGSRIGSVVVQGLEGNYMLSFTAEGGCSEKEKRINYSKELFRNEL